MGTGFTSPGDNGIEMDSLSILLVLFHEQPATGGERPGRGEATRGRWGLLIMGRQNLHARLSAAFQISNIIAFVCLQVFVRLRGMELQTT
jgi:hypothetical protein